MKVKSEREVSRSVVSDSLRPSGLQPTRFLRPWDFPGKSTGVGCHCLLRSILLPQYIVGETVLATDWKRRVLPIWPMVKKWVLSKVALVSIYDGLLWWLSGKEAACQCRRPRFDPSVGKIPWRRKWQPTPVFFPGDSHGRRNLVGCSPRGHKESDANEQLHFISKVIIQLFLSIIHYEDGSNRDFQSHKPIKHFT